MKIAYILPDWPIPCFRGYQRIAFERIKRLARRHEIDIFYFSQCGEDTSAHTPEALGCRAIHQVEFGRWRARGNALLALLRGEPGQVGYYRSMAMKRRVTEEMRRHGYEAIVVQLVRLAQAMPTDLSGVRILDMVDPLSLSYARSVYWRAWWSRWFYRLEAQRIERYEGRIAAFFDRVLLLSGDELKEYSRTVSKAKLAVVPYGVDLDYFRPSSEPRENGMVVLSGNLGYGPNVKAVDLFCRTIFPQVQRAVPDARLWLVGTDPHPRVRRWHNGKTVHVTGRVPELLPFLQRAMVSVCPVLHRVGTQTKILEALATATPVVAFTETAVGLVGDDRLPIQVAVTSSEFAQHVVRLLRGPSWAEISLQSRAYAERYYSWDASTCLFETILSESIK